jgi:hypothetical protein
MIKGFNTFEYFDYLVRKGERTDVTYGVGDHWGNITLRRRALQIGALTLRHVYEIQSRVSLWVFFSVLVPGCLTPVLLSVNVNLLCTITESVSN